MTREHDALSIDRRSLLLAGMGCLGGLALSNSARGSVRLFVPTGDAKQKTATRVLVLLQLSGGNDGLSMVVPYGDDGYNKVRSAIRIGEKEVLAIDKYEGLHPELKRLKAVYDRGNLAIVQGCSYPKPIRSHFKAMEIWHSASPLGRNAGEGWIGKLCDAAWGADQTAELVVHVGGTAPFSVYSSTHPAITFQTPASYKWVAPDSDDGDVYKKAGEEKKDAKSVLERLRGVLSEANESSLRIRRAAAAYRPHVDYPADEFGDALRIAATLVDAHIGSRVISVELGGFDTHNNQRQAHDGCMRKLDAGLGAFLEDIRGTSAADEVVVIAFSEFGRRVKENGSRGTDHGVAAPMFVAGTRVAGGLYGKHPSLTELDDGDLVMSTDFRSVYGTLVDNWFGVDQAKVLDSRYPALEFLKV